MFPVSLPNCKSDLVALAFDQADVHVDMANVLCELPTRPGDHNNTRLDSDSHTFWDLQFFSFENVAHLQSRYRSAYGHLLYERASIG